MENPLTWNSAQKLISKHLYLERNPEERAQRVTQALIDAELIDEKLAKQVNELIIEEIDATENESMLVCGYSPTTSIYMKLASLGLLKEKEPEDDGQWSDGR